MNSQQNTVLLGSLNRAMVLVLGSLVGQGTVACGAATTEARPVQTIPPLDEQVVVALQDLEKPCQLRTARKPEDQALPLPEVFVESFLIEIPGESTWHWGQNDLMLLARTPGARFVGSPHIIARIGEAATMSLESRFFPIGTVPAPAMLFKGMTLRPTLGERDVLVLDLDVVMQIPVSVSTQAGSPYSDAHAHNTFAAHDREVVAFRTRLPGYSLGDLVIALVAHFVQSEVDLRDIFQCKMQRRAEHLRGGQ